MQILLCIAFTCTANSQPRNDSDKKLCDVGETSTLREKGSKELFEILVNFRHNIDKIPVDEDQEVPDPRDSSISKISTLFGP